MIDKKIVHPLRAVALCLSLAAALPVSAERITILETSDLHGHVTAWDELADRDLGEGLARIAAAVAKIRAERECGDKGVRGQGSAARGNCPVLLLDAGDTIQGTPMEALHARSGKAGDPTIRAMNAASFEAMCIGNHEFNFGLEVLSRARADARFPFLSANVVDRSGKPIFVPYLVRTIRGIRIGILGLTTKNIAGWESPSHIPGLRFLDTVSTARRYVPILRGRERCDLVVVLTHQGFERDLQTDRDLGTGFENQAYALASEVSGIDLLLTGHTHANIPPQKIGSVWVAQPGRHGNFLTRFDIDFERKAGRFRPVLFRGENLAMKDFAPDPSIEHLVEPEYREAMETLGKTVATLATAVSADLARVADTALLDWLHAVQRREGRADLSFASLLPGHLPEWQAGPLTVRQIWAFYPYENTLVTVRATGRQVREALERAGRCVSGIGTDEGQTVWRRNPAVWGYNCDTMEGAEYALDPLRPEGSRLLYLRLGGREVGDEETFAVAINSYRAAGGGGYEMWQRCPRLFESERGVRELLIEDARSRRTLTLTADLNWFLVPSLGEPLFRTSP